MIHLFKIIPNILINKIWRLIEHDMFFIGIYRHYLLSLSEQLFRQKYRLKFQKKKKGPKVHDNLSSGACQQLTMTLLGINRISYLYTMYQPFKRAEHEKLPIDNYSHNSVSVTECQ